MLDESFKYVKNLKKPSDEGKMNKIKGNYYKFSLNLYYSVVIL